MPKIQTWIIIGLIVFAWVQYTWPDKVESITDPTFGKLNEYIKVEGAARIQETIEEVCPDTYEPVCGNDGITYDNLCNAMVAGIYETELGECEDD